MNQGFQVMKLSHNFGRLSLSSWLILNINHMTGGTSGVGTASSFVAPEFTLGIELGSCCSIHSFLCSIL
jgi:hypothetical protein